MHAFETPFKGLFSQGGSAQKKHQEQMNIMLEEEKRAFVTPFSVPSSRLNWKLGEGAVRDVIAREVETLHPDLLVIGTHGRTGVAHALLGSVAENLLSDPPCDILAVKAW